MSGFAAGWGVLALVGIAIAAATVARSAPTGTPPPRIVFAVNGGERSSIDPVVLVRSGGRLSPPPTGEEGDASLKQFIRKYLDAGHTYGVLFGGAVAGKAAVKERPSDPEIGLEVPVTLRATVPLSDKTMALAVEGGAFGPSPLQRRAPTVAERAALLRLAQGLLAKKGATRLAVQKASLMSAAALNLDGRSSHELITGVHAEQKGRVYELLLLAESAEAGGGLRAGLSVWHVSKGGIEDGDRVEQEFVDALDLDGDGVAEVVTRSLYYESHDYTIYRKGRAAGATWRAVYRGAGGGV
jgi:hypothetical protein